MDFTVINVINVSYGSVYSQFQLDIFIFLHVCFQAVPSFINVVVVVKCVVTSPICFESLYIFYLCNLDRKLDCNITMNHFDYLT